MTPSRNHILVKLPAEINAIKTKSGIELSIDTTWHPEQFQPVYGEVVALPEQKLNLKVGDRVYFFYLTILNAKECSHEGMYYEEGQGESKERFAVIPVSSLFFAIWYLTIEREKDDRQQFEMFNDTVLVQPILLDQQVEHIEGYGNFVADSTYNSPNGLIISAPEKELVDIDKIKKYDDQMGIVAHAKPGCGVEPGDTILFSAESDVPVEFDLIQTLPLFFRMNISDIMCKIVDGEADPINNKVIVQPDPPKKVQTSLILLENGKMKPRYKTGVVKKVGPLVTWVEVGDRIVYGVDGSATDLLIDYDKHEIIDEKIILTKYEC